MFPSLKVPVFYISISWLSLIGNVPTIYVVDISIAQSMLEHRKNNIKYETLSIDLISAGGKSVDILVSTLTYRQLMASMNCRLTTYLKNHGASS